MKDNSSRLFTVSLSTIKSLRVLTLHPIPTVLSLVLKTETPMSGPTKVVFGSQDLYYYVLTVLLPMSAGHPTKKSLLLLVVLAVLPFVILKKITIGGPVST